MLGNKEQYIVEVKTYLNTFLRYYKLGILEEDTIYDEKTKKAVEIFQRRNNLEVTGIVDYETFHKIHRVHKEIVGILCEFSKDEYKNPASLCFIVQAKIMNIAKKYSNVDTIDLSGESNLETEKAILQLQEIMNINKTGKVNYKTWKSLIRL